MATNKQIEANRRNAQKSTGPRSLEGRARSARNALKDGYTAETVVLTLEEQPRFDRMHQDFTDQYQPITICEEQYLVEMVWARWRTHRIWNAEGVHLEVEINRAKPTLPPGASIHVQAGIVITDQIDKMDKFLRYEQRLTRQFNRAKANLLEAQEIRRSREEAEREPPPPPQVVKLPVIPLERPRPYLLDYESWKNEPNWPPKPPQEDDFHEPKVE